MLRGPPGEAALDGITPRVDDHRAMPRVRSPIRRGRWLLSGVVLLLLAIGAILVARGGAQEAPRLLLLSDMRDVTPTLARRVGLTLPTANGKILLP